jgi:hypothetical protein
MHCPAAEDKTWQVVLVPAAEATSAASISSSSSSSSDDDASKPASTQDAAACPDQVLLISLDEPPPSQHQDEAQELQQAQEQEEQSNSQPADHDLQQPGDDNKPLPAPQPEQPLPPELPPSAADQVLDQDAMPLPDSSGPALPPQTAPAPPQQMRRPHRPAAINNEALLRLLAGAYAQMMAEDGSGAAMSDDEVERWLRQLLALSAQPGSDTVVALHRSLREDHSWLRLSDVYSALLYLRQKYAGPGGQGL